MSLARFCNTSKDGPTPHAIENLISVCSFAGPATPIFIGKFIPFVARSFAQSITGFGSKQNCVVKAISNDVLSFRSCFHFRARSIFFEDPSGSISLLPSGCPAKYSFLKLYLSNKPVSTSCIESLKFPIGLTTPPAKSKAFSTLASSL